jgi:hypothetical protein
MKGRRYVEVPLQHYFDFSVANVSLPDVVYSYDPLKLVSKICFVKGHDFSRAEKALITCGL